MDNEQNNLNLPEENIWSEETLGVDTPKELGPDEAAVHSAGLTHPDDLELEKILSEDWDSVPDIIEQPSAEMSAEPESAAEEVPAPSEEPAYQGETQFFQPVSDMVVETEPEPEPEKPAENVRIRKIRPKPKKGYGLLGIPHILATFIWIALIVAIGLTAGHTLWISITDLMAFGKPDQQITVTITEEDVRQIQDGNVDPLTQKLKDAGLIEYPTVFKLFSTKLTDKAYGIEAGTYVLNSKYDYNAMINNMQSHYAARVEVEVLIPEGYTCAQIFSLLEEKNVCSVKDMEDYMVSTGRDGMDGKYALSDYWFLDGSPSADKYWLEGFLFPDTYRFFENDEPETVVKKFLDGFDYRFNDEMHKKLENIKSNTGLNLSIRDVVIIASMIEKESADMEENYNISSVIFNRLKNSSNFPYLNIDATIIYALGGNIDPTTGQAMPLTDKDMNLDHPYNTYKNRGLPPGPISNPGRNALDAALSPDDTNYFYYVLNPKEEKHLFASTYSEHEKNINYVNSLD